MPRWAYLVANTAPNLTKLLRYLFIKILLHTSKINLSLEIFGRYILSHFNPTIKASDENAPGAFVRPSSAYCMAKEDLNSKDWQSEIEGLEAIVRLLTYHQDIIMADIDILIQSLVHECKNLRSQVTRAALQTLVILFRMLGKRDMVS